METTMKFGSVIFILLLMMANGNITINETDNRLISSESNKKFIVFNHPDQQNYWRKARRMIFAAESSDPLVSFDEHSRYTPFTGDSAKIYGGKYLSRGQYHRKCADRHKSQSIRQKDVHEAVDEAGNQVEDYRDRVENDARNTKRKPPYVSNGALDALVYQYATQRLKRKRCLSKLDVVGGLPLIDTGWANQEMPACRLDAKTRCEPKARFRSIDGSCNNLKQPGWGRSFSCHRRLLPPDYGDGVAAPRRSWNGGPLPNARDLSLDLLPERDVTDHRLTAMAMAFGQFAIHDIARTLPTGNDIQCCPPESARHPECLAIPVTRSDDPFLQRYNQSCINFVRTIPCNRCSLGPREQLNQATHTFDMSQMYGLRLNESLALRTGEGGKLRGSYTSTSPPEELPPKMRNEERGCNIRPEPPRFKCFETADGIRASQHPALQSLHTAFHRRHNQHAEALAQLNPHWGDEKLYQEARRITVAEECAIIYGQYLPAIFGKKLMKHFRLGLQKYGYSRYDRKLDPSTLQEFIVASGRFGHSQVNDQFGVTFTDPATGPSYSFRLRDNFFETTIVSLGHSGGILQGLITDPGQATDPYFGTDIKNSLYRLRGEKIGRDLPAFNIQRGREHGIAGYVNYLDFCFGYKVRKWSDLSMFIPKKQLNRIRNAYDDFRDIDLFIGGISERPVTGAAFGPTFACINGIQFYNLKYGDRFFFEHGHQSGSFTPAQLANIKKVSSLSTVICKTHTEVDHMPLNPFRRTSPNRNPLKPCFTFPDLDYSLWADNHKNEEEKSSEEKQHPESAGPYPVFRSKYSMMAPRHRKPPGFNTYHYQYAKPGPTELMMATAVAGTIVDEELPPDFMVEEPQWSPVVV